jgi:hypothetical protein
VSGSFTCRKSTTWDIRLYFPSKGRHADDFFVQKIRRLQPGLNPRTWVPEASMLTTRPLMSLLKRQNAVFLCINIFCDQNVYDTISFIIFLFNNSTENYCVKLFMQTTWVTMYSFTPKNIIFLQKLIVVKSFFPFRRIWRLITVVMWAYQWSFFWAHTHIQCTPSKPFSLVSCLLPKHRPSDVWISGFPSIMSHISHARYVSRPSHCLIISWHQYYLVKKIILKLRITRFSTASFTNYLLGHA